MGDGVTSSGTSTDLPVTVNINPVTATAKLHAPPKTQKADKVETPPAALPEADDYKKLIAKAQGLGIKLDFLDEQGNVKPDKLEEVKARVSQVLDARIKEAAAKGIKPDDPQAVVTVFLPPLLKNSEFVLLPRETQIALLKEKGFATPEKFVEAIQKDYPPNKKFAHVIRLEAQVREAKGGLEDKKDAARLFDAASAFDPTSVELHRAAARNFKAWADAETNPDDKQKLYTLALNHLDPVIKANPKEVDLLKMGGQILTALGKADEADKLFGMAMKIKVDEFKALQAEHKKNPTSHHPTKPEGAKELEDRVKALEGILKQVEDIPANTPELKLQRLQCQREYYKAFDDFKLQTYPPPYNIWQPSKEYDAYCEKLRSDLAPYKAKVDEATAAMHALRADLAKTADNAGLAPDERLKAARLSVEVAKAMGDNKARVEDLDHWKKTIDSFGYSDLHGAPRAQEYSDLFKEWFQFRREMTDKDVIDLPSDRLKEKFSIDTSEATSRMRDIVPRIRESFDYLNVKDAMDNIDHMLNRMIDWDDTKLLPFVSSDGLEKYAQAAFEADQKLEIAKKNLADAKTPEDLKKARGDLVQVLSSYVELRDRTKAGDVVKIIEGTLKPDMTPTGRLEVYTALAMALKGSGFSDYDSVREKGTAIAGDMASKAILTTTFTDTKTPIEDARTLIIAKTFFETIDDKEKAKAVNAGLEGLGEKILNQLNSGDPKIRPTDPKERVQLASLIVQVDQALLETQISEATKADAKGPESNTIQVSHLGVLRKELENAKDLPFNDRLEQFKRLASAAATCQTLTKPIQEGQKSIIDPDTLKTETETIGKLGDSLLSDALMPGPGATEDQKAMAAKMAGDLKARFHQALDKGEVSWLSEMTPASLTEFAMVSGKANRLLDEAKTLPADKAEKAMALYLEAGRQFGLLGLNGRVTEAVKPVLEYTRTLTDPMAKLSGFLAVSGVYQQAKMTTEANAALQELIDLDKPGASSQITEAAQIARGMQKLNSGELDDARDIFRKLPKNELAKAYLEKIEEGQKGQRISQSIEVVRAVFTSRAQSLREKGKKDEADQFEKAANGAFDEVKRLVLSGKQPNLEAAFRRVMDDPRFYAAGFGGYFYETGPGWKTWSYIGIADDPRVSTKDFGRISLSFAKRMTEDKYYGSAMAIADLFKDDVYVRDQAEELKKDIPDIVKGHGIFSTVKSLVAMNPVGVFLEITFTPKELGSDEDPVTDIVKDAAIGVATFGIGKGFAIAADAVYVSRAASLLSRPLLYSAGRWAVRSGAEATGFVLGGMTAQTILTGRTDQWTLSHFGKDWGSMLVMFGLLHGVGMGFGRFGKFAEAKGWTESATFRATFKTAQYTSSITAMVGASKINQALGLKDKDKSSLYLQFLGEMATFHLMNRTQRLFEGTLEVATLGKVKLGQIEQGTQAKFESQVRVKKMGIDPASPDGRLLVDVMTGKVSDADFSAEAQKRFGPTIKSALKVDPESPEGKELASVLFLYANQGGTAGKPLSAEELQTTVQRLNHSVEALLEGCGVSGGKGAEVLRRQILRLALNGTMKPETMAKFAAEGPKMKEGLQGIVDKIMGKGASETPQGQKLMGSLLLKSMTETSDPAKLTDSLKGLTEVSSESGKNLRALVNGLLGKDASKTPEGRELMAILLMNAVAGSEKSSDIPAKIQELVSLSFETGKSLKATVDAVLGKGAAETTEGRRLASALVVTTLATMESPADLPKIIDQMRALAETLGGRVPNLFELSDFKDPKERIALFKWAIESGQSPEALKALQKKVAAGEVELVFEKGEVKLKEIPAEAREAQRQKIYDRVPLEEIPAEYLPEVYVQEIKSVNLGGGRLNYVAYRGGKEVGDLTVREEKDGGIFIISFADKSKEHGQDVLGTLLKEATAGKNSVRLRILNPITAKALQGAHQKGATPDELSKIFSETDLGKGLEGAGFNTHEITRNENGSFEVVSKPGPGQKTSSAESGLTAAALLGIQVMAKAVPLPGEATDQIQLFEIRSQAGLKLANDFGLRDSPFFLSRLGQLLQKDVKAGERLGSGAARDEVIKERVREAAKVADHFGRGEDVEFKKALAEFVVGNLHASEKLGKGKVESAKDDQIADEVAKTGQKPGVAAIADPVTSKEIALLAKSNTPFARAARAAQAGRMTVDQYRAAQKAVGVALVEAHRPALKKIETLLKSFQVNPDTKDCLATDLKDANGDPIENPHGRMKDPNDIAPKLDRRGWSHLGPLTDIAGARIVVKSNADVATVLREIEGRYKIRDVITAEGLLETVVKGVVTGEHGEEIMNLETVMDRDSVERLLVGHPERGYRALHVVVEVDGKPVEIQIQTEAMFEWGKVQHSLVYKNTKLPSDVLKGIQTYCRDAAQYLTELDLGVPNPKKPALPSLPDSLKGEERTQVETDLKVMSDMMDRSAQTRGKQIIYQGQTVPKGAGVLVGTDGPTVLSFNRTFYQRISVKTSENQGMALFFFGTEAGPGQAAESHLYVKASDPVRIFRKSSAGYEEVPFSEGKVVPKGRGQVQFNLQEGDIIEAGGKRFTFLRDPQEIKTRASLAMEGNISKQDPAQLAKFQQKVAALGRAEDGTPLVEKQKLQETVQPSQVKDVQPPASKKTSSTAEVTKVDGPKGKERPKAVDLPPVVGTADVAGFLYEKIFGGDQLKIGKETYGYHGLVGVLAFKGGDVQREMNEEGVRNTKFYVIAPGRGHGVELSKDIQAWMKSQKLTDVEVKYVKGEVGSPPLGLRITGLASSKERVTVEIDFAGEPPNTASIREFKADFEKRHGTDLRQAMEKGKKDPMGFGTKPEYNQAWMAHNALGLMENALADVKRMEDKGYDKIHNFSDSRALEYSRAREQLAICREALELYQTGRLEPDSDTETTRKVDMDAVLKKAGPKTTGATPKTEKKPAPTDEDVTRRIRVPTDQLTPPETPKAKAIFLVGKGEAMVTILTTPENRSPSWRVVDITQDAKGRDVIKLKNLIPDVNKFPEEISAVSPGPHTLQKGMGVEYIPLGGGGKALAGMHEENARIAKALIAQYESNNAGQKNGTYDQAQDTSQIKAARAYVAAVEAGKTPPLDISFLDGVKDYYYSVSAVESGKLKPLGILVPGKSSARNEKWKFTVVSTEDGLITVKNAKGGIRTLSGLPAARGSQETMPHLFKEGDEVVLIPQVAGGSGEAPPSGFKVPFQEITKGQFVVDLGRKMAPEFNTDTISDRHARLRYDQSRGVFTLQDLGSTEGTFVAENGDWVKVEKGVPRSLQFDQVFALGTERFFKVGKDFLIYPTTNPFMPAAVAKEEPAQTGPLVNDTLIRTIKPTSATKEFVVGSSAVSDLVFQDSYVSGTHFTLQPGQDGWSIIDGKTGTEKKSSNGVWVNGTKMTDKAAPIKDGNLIQIMGGNGGLQFWAQFRFHAPEAAPDHAIAAKGAVSLHPSKDITLPRIQSIALAYGPDPAKPSDQVCILGNGERVKNPPSNFVSIPSSEVSRKHAQLRWSPQGLYIKDLGSSNGTWVKEKGDDWVRLEQDSEILIAPGQEFALGRIAPDGDTKDAIVLQLGTDGRIHTTSEMIQIQSDAARVPAPVQKWETDLKAGDVDMANPPVVTSKATDKMGSSAGVTTQGTTAKENEDGILQVKGPNGEMYLFDADGMGGQGNGQIAAKLTLEAYRDEIQRSGDPEKAIKFANAVVSRFNGSLWVIHGYDPKVKFATTKEREAAMKKIANSDDQQIRAAETEARKVLADPKLAAFDAGPMAGGAGAVAVSLTVTPPAKAGDPHVVHFHWVGDARGTIFERGDDGRWHWIYRTVDESAVGNPDLVAQDPKYELKPETYYPGGRGKTMVVMLHPKANVVVNGVGLGREDMVVKKTGDGEIPNLQVHEGASRAKGLERGIVIEKGQLALLGSDGLWENYGYTSLIEALIQNCKTADEVVKVLTDETHFRMEVLTQVRETLGKAKRGEIPPIPEGQKFKFERPEGILYGVLVEKTYQDQAGVTQTYVDVEIHKATTLYIDGEGRVYEHLNDTNPVDHYKMDNLSIMAYLHNPSETGNAAAPSKKAKGPLPPPVRGSSVSSTVNKGAPPPPSSGTQTLPVKDMKTLDEFTIGKDAPKQFGIQIEDPTLAPVQCTLRRIASGELWIYGGKIGGKPSVTGVWVLRQTPNGGTTAIRVKDAMQLQAGDRIRIPVLGGFKEFIIGPGTGR